MPEVSSLPRFEQHGAYRLGSDDFILGIEASGLANEETISAHRRDIFDAVLGLGGETFAIHSRNDGQVLLTHEADLRLRKNFSELVAVGMCAAALDHGNSDDRLIVAAQIGSLYGEIQWSGDSYCRIR